MGRDLDVKGRRRRGYALVLVVPLLLAACDDDDGTGPDADAEVTELTFEYLSSPSSPRRAGRVDSVRVVATGADLLPVAGARLAFGTSAGASVQPQNATTDDDGAVVVAWTHRQQVGPDTLYAWVDAKPDLRRVRAVNLVPDTVVATVRIEAEADTIQVAVSEAQLRVRAFDAYGNEITNPQGVVWTSLDPEVAIVTFREVDAWLAAVAGAEEGTARIVATLGGAADTVEIVVLPPPPDVGVYKLVQGGTQASCALTTDGKAYCWGNARHGALGNGEAPTEDVIYPAPQAVQQGALSFDTLAVAGYYACGLTAAGEAYCWGDNTTGNVGNGVEDGAPVAVPTRVVGGHTFARLIAGGAITCGITPAGELYCWGWNLAGGLARPSAQLSFSATPLRIELPGGAQVASASGGISHACATTTTGEAYCWGDNSQGQLGDGTVDFTGVGVPTPVRVNLPEGVQAADVKAVPFSQTCLLGTNGSIYCWGEKGGVTLLENDFAAQLAPVRIEGLPPSTAWGTGGGYACVLTPQGDEYCWGNNASGVLGSSAAPVEGRGSDRVPPIRVEAPAGVAFSALGLGAATNCALSARGAAYCWGWNLDGEVGIGETEPFIVTTPRRVLDPGAGAAVAARAIRPSLRRWPAPPARPCVQAPERLKARLPAQMRERFGICR